MAVIRSIVALLDAFVLIYLGVFFVLNFWFCALALRRVVGDLRRDRVRPPDQDERDTFLPLLSLLVPAYSEEVTCVESVRSRLRLRYPRYEIILCNDGSKDRTLDALREAFGFVRTDINYQSEIETAPLRGL